MDCIKIRLTTLLLSLFLFISIYAQDSIAHSNTNESVVQTESSERNDFNPATLPTKSNSKQIATADTLQTVTIVNTDLDSLCVSIITCEPGKDLYTKFGHTALRIQNSSNNDDIVFNYGCFNYNSDNFVYKYILGQTDYLLEAEPAAYFIERYKRMGVKVSEQVLNLTPSEESKLFILLEENLLPENQEYRYSWLYDNCTERARDMLEKAVEGKIRYNRKSQDMTVRDILRGCLKNTPWIDFGINMILGFEIDKVADQRTKMFIPAFFENEVDGATIERTNNSPIDYVLQKKILLDGSYEEEDSWIPTPIITFSILAAIVVLITLIDIRRRLLTLWIDVLLHILQGIAGILVSFLFFFSEHPAVDSNMLVIVFNPLSILYATWLIFCHVKRRRNIFAGINLVILALFIISMFWAPQCYHPAMYIIVSILLIRALANVMLNKYQQNRY